MDKESINKRFLEVIDYLLTQNLAASKAEISTKLEVGRSTFSEILKKRMNVGTNHIAILCKFYPVSSNWILTGRGAMTRSYNLDELESLVEESTNSSKTYVAKKIPLIPIEAIAGIGSGEIQIDKRDVIESYVIPEFERRGAEYMIRVSGSSMYPKYNSGDLLGCKRINDYSFFAWGKPYVLDTDHGAIVKRLFQVEGNDDLLECRSDNSESYPPFVINKKSIYRISIVLGVVGLE